MRFTAQSRTKLVDELFSVMGKATVTDSSAFTLAVYTMPKNLREFKSDFYFDDLVKPTVAKNHMALLDKCAKTAIDLAKILGCPARIRLDTTGANEMGDRCTITVSTWNDIIIGVGIITSGGIGNVTHLLVTTAAVQFLNDYNFT